MVHFGSKVTSTEQYEKAVRDEKGGAHVFGTRVRNSIPETGPTNLAKRQSEFGPLTTAHAQGSDTKGKPNESVSIEELKNILVENPTTFDSLYEVELARAEGARPEALGIFYPHEIGIKGQMRQDVMSEIKGLMNEKGVQGAQEANAAVALGRASDEMAERNRENALLTDAPRIKELKERAENLKIVEAEQKKGTLSTQIALDTERQADAHRSHEGEGAGDGSSATGTESAKPDGDVHVETQSRGPRGPATSKTAKSASKKGK